MSKILLIVLKIKVGQDLTPLALNLAQKFSTHKKLKWVLLQFLQGDQMNTYFS